MPRRKEIATKQDLLIAGSLALGSVAVLLGIMLAVARAVREEPGAA